MDNDLTAMEDLDRLNEMALREDQMSNEGSSGRTDAPDSDTISMKVGDDNGIDVRRDSHYTNMSKDEQKEVAQLGTELFGSQFEVETKAAIDGGRTPGTATIETAKAFLERNENIDVKYETVADLIKNVVEEKVEADGGTEQEKIEALKGYVEGGTESFKEKVLELAASESKTDISADDVTGKLEQFKETVEALESKETYAQERSAAMSDKLETYAKYDDLSPRNTFKAFAGLAVKIQAYQDKVPINGKVPSAAGIIMDVSYALRTNIFESIVELAIASIEHAIEQRQEDVAKSEAEKDAADRGVENEQEFIDADNVNKTDSEPEEPERKLEVTAHGFSDSGTVTKGIGREERTMYLERNPAIGSVGGVSLKWSNIDRLSYTDKRGVERTNPLTYNVRGLDDKVVSGAKIFSSTTSDAKYAVAADRTVIAAWGVDADVSKVGGAIDYVDGYKNVYLNMDANGVEFNAPKHGEGMSVADYGKASMVESYAKFVDTYIDVANKEKSEIGQDRNDLQQDRDALQAKLDALSDQDKESKFGVEVKERIAHLDSCIEKYEERTEKIDNFVENAKEFKGAYKDYHAGKTTLDDVLQKEVKAEDSAISRSMECASSKANGVTWKDGYRTNGVEVIERGDQDKANDSHSFIEHFDERKEAFDAEEEKNNVETSEADRDSADNDTEKTDADNKNTEADNENVDNDNEKADTDAKEINGEKVDSDGEEEKADRTDASETNHEKVDDDHKEAENDSAEKPENDHDNIDADNKDGETDHADKSESDDKDVDRDDKNDENDRTEASENDSENVVADDKNADYDSTDKTEIDDKRVDTDSKSSDTDSTDKSENDDGCADTDSTDKSENDDDNVDTDIETAESDSEEAKTDNTERSETDDENVETDDKNDKTDSVEADTDSDSESDRADNTDEDKDENRVDQGKEEVPEETDGAEASAVEEDQGDESDKTERSEDNTEQDVSTEQDEDKHEETDQPEEDRTENDGSYEDADHPDNDDGYVEAHEDEAVKSDDSENEDGDVEQASDDIEENADQSETDERDESVREAEENDPVEVGTDIVSADEADEDAYNDTDSSEEDRENALEIAQEGDLVDPEQDIGLTGDEIPDNPIIEAALAEAGIAQITEFSYDDDYSTPVDVDEPETKERNSSIAFEKHEDSAERVDTSDFSFGIERMNEHMDEYSFADFIDDYKDALAEDGADQKLIEAYADYIVDLPDGVAINSDLTYSLAFYDEGGFCVGMENIEKALEERGMSEDFVEMVSESATDKFCEDNVVDIQFNGGIIEISVPITRDQEFAVFDVDYKVSAGDDVVFTIDFENDLVVATFTDEYGNYLYEDVDGEDDKAHFACEILGNIYGLDVGDMLTDVYDKLVESPGQEDLGADLALEKILNHLGDIIDARGLDKIEQEEKIEAVVDNLVEELDAEYNDPTELTQEELEARFEEVGDDRDFDVDEYDLP